MVCTPPQHPPAEYYRRVVEDYARDAEHSFPFHVYKLEGWTPLDVLLQRTAATQTPAKPAKPMSERKRLQMAAAAAAGAISAEDKAKATLAAGVGAILQSPTGDEPSDTLVPFMQRVEFGVNPHLERTRQNSKGKIPDNVKMEELLKDKSKCAAALCGSFHVMSEVR